MDITGIGTAAEAAKGIIGMFFPDKTESEKNQLAASLALIQAQTDINKVEAGNPSVFVSGWRPAIGWICGAGCAWNWVGLPIAKAAMLIAGHPVSLSPADMSEMMPLLLGMLGLGGLRTAEKISGVAAR
ncbi:MAG: hypothetical protein A3E01_00145 [Gammaproteobacteria bacterium RIFCSPHIGHO2_12_FULL_63_22]|nr:MAG: hypothetical protein A3E01_00145 [Gammaproteobacteria bacterium RIFCSPHIGHO2_12_FULL_63_22]